MDKKLSILIDELYELDPSLKEHDSLLCSVLGEILAARPEAQMDPAFYRDLRETLLSRIRETNSEESETTPRFSFFSRFGTAFAGLAVVTGVAVLANTVMPSSFIRPVGKDAFGSLVSQSVGGEKGGLGGGGESAMVDSFYYPDERVNYHFNYVGDTLTMLGSVEVLKRVSANNDIDFNIDFDSFDVGALGHMKAGYFTLQPTGEEGYSLSYDPNAQTISLNAYHAFSEDCPWGYCNEWMSGNMTAEELPSDEALIAAADAFMDKMDIDLRLTGAPYVSDYFVGEGSEVSSELNVVYPFEIDGTPVYNNWGGRAGISVNIDARRFQVMNVNWIYTSNSFESSDYTPATLEQVMAVAENGGTSTANWEDPTETVEFDLGTPTLVYSQLQNYSSTGAYTDLYVPAYAFPILSDPEDLYYGDTIIVPLAAELAVISAPPMILY